MKRNKTAYLFYGLILLALFGLVSQLFGDTRNFIMGIFMMLGFGVAVFAVFYFLVNRSRGSSDEMKKYKQAVKQSKSKYQQSTSRDTTRPSAKQKFQSKQKGKRRPTHLRVIEGNKPKDKDATAR